MEPHQAHSFHSLMRQDTVSDFRTHLQMHRLNRADTTMDFQSPSSSHHSASIFRTQTQLDVSSSTPIAPRSGNIFQQDTVMDNKSIARRPADIIAHFVSLIPKVEDFAVTANEIIELGRGAINTSSLGIAAELISKNHCTITAHRIRKRSNFLDVPSSESTQYIVTITDTSTNGTYVNGVKIGANNSYQLLEGDVISLVNPETIVYKFTYIKTPRSPSSPVSPNISSSDLECCTSPLEVKKRRMQEIEMDNDLIQRSISLFDE